MTRLPEASSRSGADQLTDHTIRLEKTQGFDFMREALYMVRVPVFPIRRRSPFPSTVYRMDARSPSDVFRDGFSSWGRLFDIVRHISNEGACSLDPATGFISVAEDLPGAVDILLRWTEHVPVSGHTDVGEEIFSRADAQHAGLVNGMIAKLPPGVSGTTRSLIESEKEQLRSIKASRSDVDGWYEIWVYSIEGSRYLINCAEQLRDDRGLFASDADPARCRFVTAKARARAARGGLWAAPLQIPGSMVRAACRARFAFVHSEDSRQRFEVKVAYDEGEVQKNPVSGPVFNPFTDKSYDGLLSYLLPPSEEGPGGSDYQPPSGWTGESEYWDGATVRQPGYPGGRPDDGDMKSFVPAQEMTW
ncbi:hypothetical protein AB8O64_35565 (plasmid) [Streptomyces sp. QH1-20]|uniref:hypothetical protein n=1 Tax=Streptomyces sp. QH1-20 TaxID=3240934 RepID=UPI003519876C